MEDSVKPGEDVEMVVPQKKKTLKQARLPFQMLSSVDSPNLNKKRKLASPTPIECKSPKIVKITTKENSFDTSKAKEPEIISLEDPVEEDEKSSEKSAEKEADDVIEKEAMSIKTTPKSKGKKSEEKFGVKPGALNRFIIKTDSKDSQSSDEKVKPDQTNNADVSIECDITNGQNQDLDIDSKKHESEIPQTEVSQSKKIERQASPEKSEPKKENHDSKDSFSSVKATSSKAESEKDDNSQSEQDSQEAETSRIESDSESSEDELCTDQKTDNDEPEERKKVVDGRSISSSSKKAGDSIKQKKMTPKQLEKKFEKQKRHEERQKLRLEREKKKEEERENRRREKEEKKKEKDEKEKVEREQKKKEKEQKELKRQMEIEQKQKEKEAKEEDRRKREEEKRRKEEERLETERKKQKAASSFVSFFVAKKPTESKIVTEQKTTETKNFMPFEVKADMRIAPVCRRTITDNEKLKFDETCEKQNSDKSDLYLKELKSKKTQPRKYERTWPPETKDDDDDVVVIENDEENHNFVDRGNVTEERHRAKLLMFKENRRPPYRGTWRKKSSLITPRKPFAKDEKWFDYEIDSDEEWEEEEPGESIRGSDDEKDEENPDDNEYDVDNEFMVPHGYLSEEEAHADEEDEEDMNPETQKFKLKILGEQFEADMKTKTSKLKPKVIGCIWQNSDNSYASHVHFQLMQFLKEREAWVSGIPITLQSIPDNESFYGSDCGTPSRKLNSNGPGAKKTRVPEEAMPDFIRLIHGNINSRGFLLKEFMSFWTNRNDLRVSKVSLSKKFREIAKWVVCSEEGPMYLKNCWYVNEDVRKKYFGEEDCGLPNRWTYTLQPKKKLDVVVDLPDKPERDEKEKEKEKEKKTVPLITLFTKKITQEEMKKQLTEKPVVKLTPPSNRPPKRVALISVGRGEQFPKSSRVSLLDKFVAGENSLHSKEVNKNMDDIMIIDDGVDKKVESKVKDQDKNFTKREESKDDTLELNKNVSEDDCMIIENVSSKNSDNVVKEDKPKLETSTAE